MIRSWIEVPLSLRSVPKIFLKTTWGRNALSALLLVGSTTRIDDKREPVVKAVVNFPDEFSDFLDRVLFHDPVPKRFSRQLP